MRPWLAARRFLGAGCLLVPALASGQAARDPRSEMDGFAAALDAAVRRVSRPSPALLAGRESARGYRLAGFGALFVLPPRALPAEAPRAASERAALRAVSEAIRHLEQGIRTASSPEVRKQMEKSLQVLDQTRAEMQQTPPPDAFVIAAPGADLVVSGSPELVVQGRHIAAAGGQDRATLRLEQLQRQLETQVAEQMRALQEAEHTRGERERELAREIELRVRELQERMEAVRRDVEQARAEAEREIEMRLADVPPPPAAPAPPAAVVPPGPEAAPAPAPPALVPAPWQFWFSADEPGDSRTGAAVVRDVKAAVTGLLEKHGATLRQLRPDEYVAVAVDFVPRGPVLGGSRVQKTLVVKVRKRDLDERQAGRLGVDELRQRIDYAEY